MHNENVDEAKKLCTELEQRDKNMSKVYTIPIKKGVKIVTQDKYLAYIKTNKKLKQPNAI